MPAAGVPITNVQVPGVPVFHMTVPLVVYWCDRNYNFQKIVQILDTHMIFLGIQVWLQKWFDPIVSTEGAETPYLDACYDIWTLL